MTRSVHGNHRLDPLPIAWDLVYGYVTFLFIRPVHGGVGDASLNSDYVSEFVFFLYAALFCTMKYEYRITSETYASRVTISNNPSGPYHRVSGWNHPQFHRPFMMEEGFRR